jgi:hypothetical protein
MRTTLTLDEDLAEALKEKAFRSGASFKQVVNEAIRSGLSGDPLPRAEPYELEPAALGGVRPGHDLDRALELADDLEDREIARKLEQRK